MTDSVSSSIVGGQKTTTYTHNPVDDIPFSHPQVTTLPPASASLRGHSVRVAGNGTTTADILYVCLMSATGTYSWKQVIGG